MADVAQHARAEVVRRAFDLDAGVLHEHRHTGERRIKAGVRGLFAREVVERRDDGVDLRVEALDAGDGGIEEFAGSDYAAAYEIGLRRGIETPEFVV